MSVFIPNRGSLVSLVSLLKLPGGRGHLNSDAGICWSIGLFLTKDKIEILISYRQEGMDTGIVGLFPLFVLPGGTGSVSTVFGSK